MPSLRIAQLMASGPVVGGLEKHFVDLCAGLANEHEVLAIADPMHAAALPNTVEFCPFDFSGSRRNPLTLMRVHRLLRSFRPDVIHAQANKAAGMVATIRHFQPATRIATVHGFKSHNRVFSRFDAVICVSRAIKERVQLPQSLVIPNGIRPLQVPPCEAQFFASNFGLRSARPVAIAAGRLAPVKGYAGLIRAWRGIDADLVIAGEGPQRPELEGLIRQLGLEQAVHLVGFRSDVPTIMANADLVVISSEREGFPYAMVEALHLEKVIVSTRFPGADDHLPARFLVPYGEQQQLHAMIDDTLSQLDAARSAYLPVWERARAELTIDHMVQQT
ncbi:MAG: glycosyltransferase, partial [Pirellulales bacterium]|nr:glycosyltransferase [Pirellulales bacterium]